MESLSSGILRMTLLELLQNSSKLRPLEPGIGDLKEEPIDYKQKHHRDTGDLSSSIFQALIEVDISGSFANPAAETAGAWLIHGSVAGLAW